MCHTAGTTAGPMDGRTNERTGSARAKEMNRTIESDRERERGREEESLMFFGNTDISICQVNKSRCAEMLQQWNIMHFTLSYCHMQPVLYFIYVKIIRKLIRHRHPVNAISLFVFSPIFNAIPLSLSRSSSLRSL